MTAARSVVSGLARRFPADLLGVVLVVILADVAVFSPAVSEPTLRIVFGLPFALFVPGYALVAVLFPEAGRSPETAGDKISRRLDAGARTSMRRFIDHSRGIDRWERVALSVALSLAIVPLLAAAVTLSPLAFSAFPLLMTISAFTVLCAVIATIRRLAVPSEQRFRVSVIDWLATKRRSFAAADSRGSVLLNIALVAAIFLAVGTFGFTVLASPDGEQFTEFYVLSEDEDGELVAADYPDTFTPGEPQSIHVGIENYEEETVGYDVVVQLQRVEESDEGTVVTERRRIDQFTATLDHDERWVDQRNLTVSDTQTGTDLRLKFFLYKGSAPGTATSETAYRDLHIWIDVEAPAQSSTASGDGTTTS